jgi:hypothetical protein
MHEVFDLDGITTVRAQCQNGDSPSLTLAQASGFLDGRYYPAESLTIDGIGAIAELHDVCARLIESYAEQTQVSVGLDPELGRKL